MDKHCLIRLLFAGDELQIDKTGKMNGRGAYLCGKPQCWETAATHSALDKALRHDLSDDDRAYLRQMKPS